MASTIACSIMRAARWHYCCHPLYVDIITVIFVWVAHNFSALDIKLDSWQLTRQFPTGWSRHSITKGKLSYTVVPIFCIFRLIFFNPALSLQTRDTSGSCVSGPSKGNSTRAVFLYVFGVVVIFTARRYASVVYAVGWPCVCSSVRHKSEFYQNG